VPRRRSQKNIIGSRVAEARCKCKPPLTQDELSGRLARVGIQLDRAAVAKIERDYRHVYDYELKGLAEVLDVSVDWLLGGDEA
jgi:transcriptional regulator with XRE-family HTH domain